ncbi:MAE_28990/MAE_18760 family HEPN-like nuclease [Methylorubrum zatmanii]|uniref:MAE_28990/MAE_18760 family HEPN-like nuclease n=1 Tax=Methylorubrum zatmanii TaxID=29429 RepID=A0ABW1WS30_9HYPH|nr:MAE_28990/MAE_18760 family HEPN-like nuclease [Methylorubrum zatmanii]
MAERACFDSAICSLEAVPDRIEWRIIDHCAAVTRIYALYEQFVHEMIREHISLLQGRLAFRELPAVIANSYRLGLAKILEKKDGPRFNDLHLGQLISEYNNALNDQIYKIEPRALLMQEQNLRLAELNRVLNACGIENVSRWIDNHKSIKEFFDAGERLTASAPNEMTALIGYRNDAAHGSIDISDVLHPNVLIEFCEFISAICEAISEKVQLAGLRALELHNHVNNHGKITELLRKGSVSIVPAVGVLKVGDTVYLCGEDYCLERRINSIQVNNIDKLEVSASVETEVGIMFDGLGRKNASILTMR